MELANSICDIISISMKSYKYIKISSLSLLIPTISFAATGKTLKDVLESVAVYLDLALKVLMGLAVVYFVYSIIEYFISPGSTEKRKEARQYIMWSLIGFFVIISLWGIVNVLSSTFNLGSNAPAWSSMSNLFPK